MTKAAVTLLNVEVPYRMSPKFMVQLDRDIARALTYSYKEGCGDSYVRYTWGGSLTVEQLKRLVNDYGMEYEGETGGILMEYGLVPAIAFHSEMPIGCMGVTCSLVPDDVEERNYDWASWEEDVIALTRDLGIDDPGLFSGAGEAS